LKVKGIYSKDLITYVKEEGTNEVSIAEADFQRAGEV
jgi:hypothetical protein